MSFVNRNANNINQRRLEVVSVEKDNNGDLTELIVNVLRNDTATVQGTKFNKEDMERAVRDTIYYQIYGITFGDGTTDVNVIGNNSVNKSMSGNVFWCQTHSTSQYEISFPNSNSYQVKVKEIVTVACDIPYYFDVYMDPGNEYKAFRIYGVIHYTPSSTNPVD